MPQPPTSHRSAASGRSVLFASSNGVGLGHLCRQLAAARRLPPELQPRFLTMSYAASVPRAEGMATFFVPHHGAIGLDAAAWNPLLAEEIGLLLRHMRPAVFAYDATAVFGGVVETLARHRDVASVWVRRAMWREEHRPFLDLADRFDTVVEPADLAEDFDLGPTRARRSEVVRVAPVLHVAPEERLERAAARRALDLPEAAEIVALQLGGGSNFDMSGARQALTAAILARPGTMLLEIRSPIAAEGGEGAPLGPRHRIVRLFPSFRYSRAFDAAVSAAGYNAFHEAILGAVPTLFVPNEAPEMDIQLNRARWAEEAGRGLVLRRDHDLPRAAALVERLLDPAVRADIAARCRALAWSNGADAVAGIIAGLARGRAA